MSLRCVRCQSEIDKSFKACPHCGEPVTEFLRRYADEPVDGKYQIMQRLGAGGMGEVYKVNHTFLGTTRVIKVIRPQISESADAHDRFLREARAATKIQHPNVATLHDFSALPDGSHYMVWEFIDGENLAQRIRTRGTLQPRYAVGLAVQALQGLEAIHRAGIVHRDISPENLMITRDAAGEERVKIIDLGVAKVEDSTDQATRTGIFVGKLRYASPEQLGFLPEGEKIDGRADVYSMGMVLYEMLTGRPPFEATSPHEFVMMHSKNTQLKPLNLPADLPGGEALQAAVARALERDRDKRYANAREFANALEEVEKSLPDPGMIRTMNVPRPDTDETMRQTPLPAPDTLHRSTVRSAVVPAPAAETVRTPFPATLQPPPQPQAQAQPQIPPQQNTVVAKPKSGSTAALAIVATLLVVALGAIGFLLYRMASKKPTTPATTTQQAAVVPPTPLSQTTVDVVPPATATIVSTESAPAVTTATATTTAPATTTASEKVDEATPQTTTASIDRVKPAIEKPKPRQDTPEPPREVRTYVEGGNADENEQALADLRQQIQGLSRVAVRGNADLLNDLAEHLKNEGSLTVSDSADVVINFYGTVERLRLGRKRRSADVTVLKNGRAVFKYRLPPEEYRVGDTPAEAFARVFIEAAQ